MRRRNETRRVRPYHGAVHRVIPRVRHAGISWQPTCYLQEPHIELEWSEMDRLMRMKQAHRRLRSHRRAS